MKNMILLPHSASASASCLNWFTADVISLDLPLNLHIASHTATRRARSHPLARRTLAPRATAASAAWILHTPTSILHTRRVVVVAATATDTAAAIPGVVEIAAVLRVRQKMADDVTLGNGDVERFLIGEGKVKGGEEHKESEELGFREGHL
ncbi:hypothetical protein SDJN03_07686, partial [Cucurbita argyrosperma subsp. sororia]